MTSEKQHSTHPTSRPATDRSAQAVFHISIDVDYLPGTEEATQRFVTSMLSRDIAPSLFVAGRAAAGLGACLPTWVRAGCELGVHGWEHVAVAEDFRAMDHDQQVELVRRASDELEAVAGVRPVAFRAPNLWVSPSVGSVLAEAGIGIDSSVPSGRADVIGRIRTLRYLAARRSPYELSPSECTKVGRSGVVEVPLLSAIVPVNLMALRLFGSRAMTALSVRIARRSGYVIFYGHPAEFCETPPGDLQQVPRRHRLRTGARALEMVEDYIDRMRAAGATHGSIASIASAAEMGVP